VIPDGGWSLLVDEESLSLKPAEVSALLLTRKVAATPMTGWGAWWRVGTYGSSSAMSLSIGSPPCVRACAARTLIAPERASPFYG